MICYVASMCLTLPVALFPVWLASQMGVVSKHESEFWSLEVGELCARWLLAIMPFLEMTVISDAMSPNPQPCIWVCNHTSMLDTFILLASDLQLRGRNKRPIKTIYVSLLFVWQTTDIFFLQSNPLVLSSL